MGKSYENFMCKKDFHPASRDNIKRVWMAEQKINSDIQKQDDLRKQYVREQDLYQNRVLMGDEKAKLGLRFMYEPPPGAKREKQKEDDEEEVKFEWQKGAPRESYAKDMDITDQPFGILVRNIRCIRCHKWGHVNTDRECPLLGKDNDDQEIKPVTDMNDLLFEMRRDGLMLKQGVLERGPQGLAANQQLVMSSEEEGDDGGDEMAFLKSLSKKDKKKLLKKLQKLESKNEEREAKKKSEKGKGKKRVASRKDEITSESESEDSAESDREQRKRKKKCKKSSKKHRKTSSSSSDVSSDEQERKKRKLGRSKNRPETDDRRDDVRKSRDNDVRGSKSRNSDDKNSSKSDKPSSSKHDKHRRDRRR